MDRPGRALRTVQPSKTIFSGFLAFFRNNLLSLPFNRVCVAKTRDANMHAGQILRHSGAQVERQPHVIRPTVDDQRAEQLKKQYFDEWHFLLEKIVLVFPEMPEMPKIFEWFYTH